jgi:flagellar hook-associated protein 3 FlgL
MTIRITERSGAANALYGLQTSQARLARLQQQLSSGKAISRPSDSPTGTASAMLLRGDLRLAAQHARNAQDGVAWLGTLDSTLTGSVGLVQQARDLTLQGMSAGSADSAAAREAVAVQIDGLRQSLLAQANTTHLGRPVFGGTTAGSQAYDQAGNYVGDDGSVLRTVGEGTRVRVDASGPATFGVWPTGVFDVLAAIAAHLRGDPSALATDIDALDTATTGMRAQLASVGTRYTQLTQLGQTATDRQADLTAQLSDVEDIDLPKTIIDLQLQQTAYQAALAATAKIVQPSLADYLR